MLERIKQLDLPLILLLLMLLASGLVALYSTSESLLQSGASYSYFATQLRWIFLGLGAMIVIALATPNRLIFEGAFLFYGGVLVLLVLVFFVGTTGLGATRWLRIGGIGFQPSEFAKIATLMAVARYLADERRDINEPGHLMLVAALLLVPFALIVKQPDLGTALVFVVMALPLLYWAGLKPRYLMLMTAPAFALIASFNLWSFGIVMTAIVLFMVVIRVSLLTGFAYFALNTGLGLLRPLLWDQLNPYQKQRILTFWNPEADPLGAGYQIIQSKVAIGSGGFLGKGFGQGSQTQLRFLPEQHTDFIFAVIGEEWGFLGVAVVLILFTLLLCRLVYLASNMRSRFSSIITIGFVTILAFHMFINVGMTVGLAPVTGLPLPFISYGGSALLTNLAIVGLILNFYRHRYEY